VTGVMVCVAVPVPGALIVFPAGALASPMADLSAVMNTCTLRELRTPNMEDASISTASSMVFSRDVVLVSACSPCFGIASESDTTLKGDLASTF